MRYEVARGMGDKLSIAIDGLEKEVALLIEKGYVPQGGICVLMEDYTQRDMEQMVDYNWFQAMQAMIKND